MLTIHYNGYYTLLNIANDYWTQVNWTNVVYKTIVRRTYSYTEIKNDQSFTGLNDTRPSRSSR